MDCLICGKPRARRISIWSYDEWGYFWADRQPVCRKCKEWAKKITGGKIFSEIMYGHCR